MGGGTLKELGVERISLKRHNELVQELLPVLAEYYDQLAVPRQPPGKTEFGDIDVLVVPSTNQRDASADPRFATRGVVRVAGMTSFEYKNCQVDLISVRKDAFELAKLFYYSDLGTILGYVCKSHGFKLGSQGFFARWAPNTGQGSLDFHLGSDASRVFGFLGLDVEDAQRGFGDHEAMYRYVAGGRFDPRCTAARPMNCKDRKRRAGRPVFMAFLEFVRGLPGEPPAALTSKEIAQLHRQAAEIFGRTGELARFEAELARKEELRAAFNGALVGKWTGLGGKSLGAFLQRCKDSHTEEELLGFARTGTLKSVVEELHREHIAQTANAA